MLLFLPLCVPSGVSVCLMKWGSSFSWPTLERRKKIKSHTHTFAVVVIYDGSTHQQPRNGGALKKGWLIWNRKHLLLVARGRWWWWRRSWDDACNTLYRKAITYRKEVCCVYTQKPPSCCESCRTHSFLEHDRYMEGLFLCTIELSNYFASLWLCFLV